MCYHVSNNDGHGIVSVLEKHSRYWDVEKAHPDIEHPSERICRKNIPKYHKVLKKRLGSTALATNTLTQRFANHLSDTLTNKI